MQNITELIKKVYEANKAKGFWDAPRNLGEATGLTIGEACGECLEAHRKGKFCVLVQTEYSDIKWESEHDLEPFKTSFEEYIKGTIEDEAADIAIRIMDCIGGFFQEYKPGWSHEYQAAQSSLPLYKGQDPDNVGEWMLAISHKCSSGRLHYLQRNKAEALEEYFDALSAVEKFCEKFGIDLDWHIEIKMAYNQTRPHKHNKAY